MDPIKAYLNHQCNKLTSFYQVVHIIYQLFFQVIILTYFVN